MVGIYRKIEERLVAFLHISTVQYPILISYLFRFRQKSCFFRILIGTYVIFKNKKTMLYDNGQVRLDWD